MNRGSGIAKAVMDGVGASFKQSRGMTCTVRAHWPARERVMTMRLATNVLADLISDELPYDYRPAAWRGSADSLRWIVFLRIGPTLIVRAVFKLFFRMISGSTRWRWRR